MSGDSTKCNETEAELKRISETWEQNLHVYAQSPGFYINVGAVVISLYFVVVLSFYEWKLRSKHGDMHKIEDQKLLSGIYKNLPRILSLVAAIVIFVQIVFFFFMRIFILRPPPVVFPCDITRKLDGALISYNYFLLYVVIWVRQRALYANKLLRHLTNKLTRFLSYASLVIALYFAFVYPLAVAIGKSYSYSACDNACVATRGGYLDQPLITCNIICMITFHALTCFLLAFPIYQSRKAVAVTSSKNHSKNPVSHPRRYLRMIKRYFVITLLSIVVDVVSALTMLIPTTLGFVQNLVMLLTIFALFLLTQLGTTNWVQALFPWWKCFNCPMPFSTDTTTADSPHSETHTKYHAVTTITPLSRSPVKQKNKQSQVESKI